MFFLCCSDLTDNQCSVPLDSLCADCGGFPEGPSTPPVIDKPVLELATTVSGKADPEATIFIEIFDNSDIMKVQDTVETDPDSIWISDTFSPPLALGDSIVVFAATPGKCSSGLSIAGTNFALVAENEPPILFGDGLTLGYRENDLATVIDSTITITDDGNTGDGKLVSGYVRIVSGYDPQEDTLIYDGVTSLDLTWDDVLGQLNITADAETSEQYVSEFMDIMREIKYFNPSDTPNVDIRVVEFSVTDDADLTPSLVYLKDIIVNNVNDTSYIYDVDPNIKADTLYETISEDGDVIFCVDVFDMESDTYSITNSTLVNSSGVILQADSTDRCFQYEPDLNYNGEDFITLTVCDPLDPAVCSETVIGFIVTAINDPPIIYDVDPLTNEDTVEFIGNEDETLIWGVNATDVENDNYNITAGALKNSSGTLTQADSTDRYFEYIPNDDFYGVDYVELTICDELNGSLCNSTVVKLSITNDNDPPIIYDINPAVKADTILLESPEDDELIFCVDVFDKEGDISAVSFNNLVNSSGTVIQADSSDQCFQYLPSSDFNGSDFFELTVCDADDGSICTNTVIELSITPENDPPVIVEASVEVDTLFLNTQDDVAINICVEADDIEGNNLSIDNIGSDLSFGTVSNLSDLCFDYSPTADDFGEESLVVKICDDGSPTACDSVVIIVEVESTNVPPEIVEPVEETTVDTLFFETLSDAVLDLCISANDLNNDSLFIKNLVSITGSGTFDNIDSLCATFNPESAETGYYEVEVCDGGSPELCDTVVLEIEVSDPNTPPYFQKEEIVVDSLDYAISEDSVLTDCIKVLDGEGNNLSISSYSFINGEGDLSLDLGSDLCFSFSSNESSLQENVLLVELCDDGDPSLCEELVITIDVNFEPEIIENGVVVDSVYYEITEKETLSSCLELSDLNGDLLNVEGNILIEGEGTLEVVIDNDLNSVCLNHTPVGAGEVLYQVTICDNGSPQTCNILYVFITVDEVVNEPPQFEIEGEVVDTVNFSIQENTTFFNCYTINDPEGDNLAIDSLQVVSGPGTISGDLIDRDLCLTYTPPNLYFGIVTVLARICDDGDPFKCSQLILIGDISPVNEAPIAQNDTVRLEDPTTLSINLLANDSDPESEGLFLDREFSFSPSYGEVIIESDSSISYQVFEETYAVVDTFSYRVCDMGIPELCSTATIVVSIEIDEPIPPLRAYEALTPNGDLINDIWIIEGINGYPDNIVRIFNQWNNLVFEAKGYNNETVVWRGETNTFLNKGFVNDGVYFYAIELGNDKFVSGFVVVKR